MNILVFVTGLTHTMISGSGQNSLQLSVVSILRKRNQENDRTDGLPVGPHGASSLSSGSTSRNLLASSQPAETLKTTAPTLVKHTMSAAARRKIAACAANHFVHGFQVNKLKAIAKSVSLTNRGVNPNGAIRKREA